MLGIACAVLNCSRVVTAAWQRRHVAPAPPALSSGVLGTSLAPAQAPAGSGHSSPCAREEREAHAPFSGYRAVCTRMWKCRVTLSRLLRKLVTKMSPSLGPAALAVLPAREDAPERGRRTRSCGSGSRVLVGLRCPGTQPTPASANRPPRGHAEECDGSSSGRTGVRWAVEKRGAVSLTSHREGLTLRCCQ